MFVYSYFKFDGGTKSRIIDLLLQDQIYNIVSNVYKHTSSDNSHTANVEVLQNVIAGVFH